MMGFFLLYDIFIDYLIILFGWAYCFGLQLVNFDLLKSL